MVQKSVKRVTRKEVALKAGVSPSTVSRALTDHPSLPVKTRQRIKRIAKQLGYRPSQLGRSYYQQRSYRLGLLIPYRKISGRIHSINNEHLTDFLYAAIQAASEEQYSIDVIADTDLEGKQLEELVLTKRVDGLVMLGCRTTDRRPAYLHRQNIPFILVHHYVRNKPYLYVESDPVMGYAELFEYLASRRVREIGLLDGPEDLVDATDRNAAVLSMVEKFGMKLTRTVKGMFTIESGMAAASEFCKAELPEVIVCTNDNMAFGLMSGLKDMNVHIPADVGIVGFDDFELSRFITPKLTTIHNPFYEMGFETGKMLIAVIRGETVESKIFPSHLVKRESI